MPTRFRRPLRRLALAAFLCSGFASAQDPGFPVTSLELAPLQSPYVGSLAMADGTLAPGQEAHFTVSNLSIFQPAAVSVVATDPGKPVTLRIGKVEWKEDFGGGRTGDDGAFVAKFRTQGDLLLSVSAPEGGQYTLMAWAGAETPPPMEPVLVPPGKEDAPAWWKNKVLLAVLALLVVGGLGWALGRRKGSAP
jgi:hypothetical protein